VFRTVIKFIIHTGRLSVGLIVYALSRKTPAFAYQSMVNLFCITRGRANDFLSLLISLTKHSYDFGGSADGVLGSMSGKDKIEVVSDLREQGYHVFEKRLPEELCDRLLEFAVSNPCISRPMVGENSGKSIRGRYPRKEPEAVRYDFATQDLLDNMDVQRLLADMSFASVAQTYLGTSPVIDVVSMWWHTAYSELPDKDAAQFYHFDMDRPKWLKFFIYLTDVTTDSGPHTFIAGSHRTGGIPNSLLKKGYARLTDDEVEGHYGRDRVVEYEAPRGTIIAEDTRGLHKGKNVKRGDRLVLQIQYSNCLFGAQYNKSILGGTFEVNLQGSIMKFPDLYSAYR